MTAPLTSASLGGLLLAVAIGGFAWTFAEYGIHHWVGHLTRGRTDFSREHLAHHRQQTYFTPNPKKLKAGLVVLTPLALLAGLLAGAPGLAFTLGFGAAWVGYELAHRSLHVRPPRTAWGRWARRHHMHHHHVDPRRNHGVTSPLWDLVFRTWTPAPTVRISRSKAPTWLLDANGDIRPEFADSYVLAGQH